MIWNITKKKEKSFDKSEWHKWFAWYPVKIKDERIWLETIIRKEDSYSYEVDGFFNESYTHWEYYWDYDYLLLCSVCNRPSFEVDCNYYIGDFYFCSRECSNLGHKNGLMGPIEVCESGER